MAPLYKLIVKAASSLCGGRQAEPQDFSVKREGTFLPGAGTCSQWENLAGFPVCCSGPWFAGVSSTAAVFGVSKMSAAHSAAVCQEAVKCWDWCMQP